MSKWPWKCSNTCFCDTYKAIQTTLHCNYITFFILEPSPIVNYWRCAFIWSFEIQSFYLIVIWPSIYPSRWYLHKQLFLHHWPNTRNIPSIINPHFIWSLFISHSINVSCAAVAVGGEWVQILNERESDVSGPPRSCPKRHRRRDGRLEGEIDNLTLSSLLSMSFSQTAKVDML